MKRSGITSQLWRITVPRARETAYDNKPSGTRAMRGQSVAEFALVLPLFIMTLAILVDLGHGIQSYVAITNAVSEGARFGSREPHNEAGIQQRVRNELSGMGITLTSISVTYPEGASAPGNPIQVKARFTFTTLLGSIFGYSEMPVSNSVEMIII